MEKSEDKKLKKAAKAADKVIKKAKKSSAGDAPAKAGKKAKSKRKALPTWKAPEDFKPFFLEVLLRTDKDGLFGTDIKATHYKGRYDPNAEDKKKTDLQSYDALTLGGILGRFSGVTFKSNNERKFPEDVKERNVMEPVKNEKTGETKKKLKHRKAARLPANTVFKVLLRVGKKSADGTLTTGIKFIQQAVKNGKGRIVGQELEKTDPAYRLIRKAKNFLPAAFKNVQQPPKRGRGGKKLEQDDE